MINPTIPESCHNHIATTIYEKNSQKLDVFTLSCNIKVLSNKLPLLINAYIGAQPSKIWGMIQTQI